MPHPDDLLLPAALRATPRRYRMPALPADADAARAAGSETALAFAIEAARANPAAACGPLFVEALAALVARALAPGNGDPAFQAQVLRSQSAEVAEYLGLAAREAADRRTVRAAVDAVAHPGKLRRRPAGDDREALERMHALASREAWAELLPVAAGLPPSVLAALQRLQRGAQLQDLPDVRRYRALCGQSGPVAGSDAASAEGRRSARVGSSAEQAALQSLRTVAGWLEGRAPAGTRYRAVGSLRTPRGFPGAGDKAKDEWDAAIVRDDDAGGPVQVVLLAEVKASAAAATPDFSRLVRGLERLALADEDAAYVFACAEGELRIAGGSLRRLLPVGGVPPANVVYCCAADEVQPAALTAATRAVLLAEPASIAFAQRLLAGSDAPATLLAPVWEALTTTPRLRSALHQYQTAVAARAAMVHPDDLLAAVRAQLDQNWAGSSD